MATRIKVTEPATPSVAPADATEPPRVNDLNKRVTVYDRVTGEKLPYKVPLSYLDGRFPNLKETPSSKAGN